MNKIITVLLTAALLSFATYADEAVSCDDGSECITIGLWDIGIAVGYGVKSNPITQFDDIPIYIIPSLAYYGEQWFFDNGNLGYSLLESENITVNMTTSFSSDSAYFSRWDPSNIFVAGGSRVSTELANSSSFWDVDDLYALNFNELEDRKVTVLGGVETFFYTRAGIFNIALAHDLLDVHSGMEAQLKWMYRLAFSQWKLELAASANWKSQEIVNYYYGVRSSENYYWNQAYNPGSATNLSLTLTTQYAINQHWELLFLAHYTDLADEIVASPLINEHSSNTFFVGVAYRF
ncbi:MipA/OmpV family protein [Shewanella algidipiscicola]|uniref:Outer membrane MltA-interaction protein MipA n=1 Tax=Shewanella algidipiscicola TaxID=614070 RepID=A0ABQ4PEX6_9GAMM|nr:MipA/OmpV family protein [Shewanella algidipiscicola]GIU45656.1 outer membrane MltA-interaction protein MipA [Shewanella algidipiscicola]